MGISKETFGHCNHDDKLAILFDLVTEIKGHVTEVCPRQFKSCDARMDVIERKLDGVQSPTGAQTAIATAGSAGIVGTAIAMLKHFGVLQ